MNRGPQRANDDLNRFLDELAGRTGFVESVGLPAGFTGPSAFRYYRRGGTPFTTAALGFAIYSRPRTAIETELIGSPLSPDALRTRGLSGNAAAFNLQQLQLYQLGRPMAELLPRKLELGPRSEWQKQLERLEAELASLPPTVWSTMWALWCEAMQQQGRNPTGDSAAP